MLKTNKIWLFGKTRQGSGKLNMENMKRKKKVFKKEDIIGTL